MKVPSKVFSLSFHIQLQSLNFALKAVLPLTYLTLPPMRTKH